MVRWLMAKYVAPHLRKPSTGFWGYITRMILHQLNTELEKETFEELQVKRSDNVLELGFGYGQGISYALDKSLRSGSGKLFGVDYSVTACDYVKGLFKGDIENGKLYIFNADVAKMPIDDETIDRVFHTNCYYFWPDQTAAATEILRVMKPGGLVTTGLNLKNLERAVNEGFLPHSAWQPEAYMDALRGAGFSDIRKETSYVQSCGADITFMYAVKP